MRGAFSERPALPKYQSTWDVTKVLDCVKIWESIDVISLKLLTFKLTMLLALLSGQRVQTIHLIEIDQIEFRKSKVVIQIHSLVKQSRPGFHMQEITLSEFVKDRRLCVVTILKEYLKRTESLRNGHKKLLVSYIAPFKQITKSSVGRWIKVVMQMSGINTNIYSPHSVRSASVSSAKVPLKTILKTAGWSRECTFRKFYKKPVNDTVEFGLSLLDP